MSRVRATAGTLLVASLLAGTLAGCRAAVADPAPVPLAGAEGHPETPTATVVRGSITSTVVLPAQVATSGVVPLTAPAAGRYSVAQGRVTYVDAGRTREVRLAPGVEVVRALVPAGRQVPANFPVAEVRAPGFTLVATLDPAALYRLYERPGQVRGQITEGPGPFDCPLVDPVPAGGTEQPTLTCVVPPALRVFAGMPAVMAVSTGTAADVLLLPVEAVAGAAGSGSVTLLGPDGAEEVRQVGLGRTDGASVEITSGLAEGDMVAVPGPDLAGGTA